MSCYIETLWPLGFPVFIDECFLDAGLFRFEVFAEKFPSRVKHLVYFNIDIYAQKSGSIFFSIVQTAEVVVREVETVLELGLWASA